MAPQTGNSMADEQGVSVIEKNGEKFVRVAAKFPGYSIGDLVVRPVEDKLFVLEKSKAVIGSYDLPESVDPFTVEAEMTSDGMLIVTAAMQC